MRAKLIADAASAKIPLAALDPTSPWFGDMDSAVGEALKRLALQGNAEQAGVVFQNPQGQYAYSIPLTMRSRDEFILNAKNGKEHKLAGIWHTHPSDHKSEDAARYFSPQDIEVATRLNLPSYIKFLETNMLRRYEPGKTRTFSRKITGQLKPAKVSEGDEVVLIPPQLFANEVAP